ncbi:MAG: C25 family cysteine peptidase [Candidatus Hatepunaea meridiana]|nr:C25 family cysteine peptidase [Candidatus Hatepunaea meridiana]
MYSQTESSDAVTVAIGSDDQISTSLKIEVADVDMQSVDFNGVAYNRPVVGLEPATTREGWPELPMIARAVLVPPTTGVHLEVTNIDFHIEREITPFIVPSLNGTVNVDLPGEPIDEYLSYDGFWPPEPVVISEPAILRGHRIVQTTVYPVQYNPATGETRFNDNVEFNLVYEGKGRNVVENPDRLRPSRYVNRILKNLVVNPPEPSRDDFQSGSYLYIIPRVNGIEDAMEPLLEWRNRQGHKVVVEYVNNAAGVNTIMNLIRDAYDDWDVPVEFVALVGDATGSIALGAATQYGDYNYSRVDGNDPLPDVAVGRLSVSSMNELNRVVNKIVSYEVAPPIEDDDSWCLQGAVVAGYPGNGYSTVLVARYVRRELLNLGFEEVRHWYHNVDGEIRDNQDFVTQAFDWGVSIFHYRAYQRMNHIPVHVLDNLPNTNGPYPPVLAISCNTGDFVNTTGNTESIFRARGGGVGAIGTCTAGTNVRFNNMMSGGVWKCIYKDGAYAFGWGLNSGKYELWRAYNGFDNGYMSFMEWNNLIGDPGTHILTGRPREIEVTYEEEIALGESYFAVSVEDVEDEIPVPEALVCLYKPDDELHLTAYTDDEGVAIFLIPADDISEGEMMVTVTKHNHLAHLGETEITEMDYYLGVEEWEIEDDEDGTPNPGESIEITLYLKNFGTDVPEGPITITAESLSEWAEVTSDPVETDDVPEGDETVEILVDLDIHNSAPDGEMILLAVNTSKENVNWESLAVIEIESPRISITDINIIEDELEPGSFSELDIEITNIGRKTLPAFSATLWSETNLVRIIQAESRYDEIASDGSETVSGRRFEVSAHPYTIPGMEVEVYLAIEVENGFCDTTSLKIPVSHQQVTAPFGPDEYGYVCFDSGDEGWEMTPVYEWIEIDPREDENDFEGEDTGLRDSGDNQDRSVMVELPFTFKYYGEEFDQLTICTNGWAAFGNQRELADFRNRHIAQALGPNAQLCVFWDNLITHNNGGIYTYYDEDEGRFIVEWSRVYRLIDRGVGDIETFQLILYDVRMQPTYSGNGIIVYQYKEVTNGQAPAHNDTPYATIGISNLDDSDGLEYTYWNQFHPGAMRLQDEMAIKFTTATQLIVGTLAGWVIDYETGNPIVGAEITTTRGFWGVTDEEGEFAIDDILIGDGYEVTIRAQGYNDSTRFGDDDDGYTIEEDRVTPANFALLHPEFNNNQDSFEYQVRPGTIVETSLNISNDGNGTLNFTSRYVYVFDDDEQLSGKSESGGPLRNSLNANEDANGDANATTKRDDSDEAWEDMLSWSVTDSLDPRDSRINGIIYIDDEWIVSGSNNSQNSENYFYIFDRWGRFIEAVEQPFGGYGARDMDYYDDHLYCTTSDTAIYKVDPESFEIVETWETPGRLSNVRNIAIDPATGAIYSGGINNPLHKLEIVDSTLVSVDNFDPNDPRDNERIRRYGFAWFRDDPDGYNLYIISDKEFEEDPEHPNVSIFKMNPVTGEVIFITDLGYLDANFKGRGGACITPKWNNMVWAFATVFDNPSGDMAGVYELAPNSSWIDYSPRSDILIASEEVTIDIVINSEGLDEDSYGVVIEFQHNADDGITHIPVSLDVGPDFAIEDETLLPLKWSLDQNYPNPFNSTTSINYSLKTAGPVKLLVYDIIGRKIAELVDKNQEAGNHQMMFNCKEMAAGVYFYKLEATGYSAVRKMVLMK